MVTLACWAQVMPAPVTAQMSESTRSAVAADSLSLLLPLAGCIELSHFSPVCKIQVFQCDLMEWTGSTRAGCFTKHFFDLLADAKKRQSFMGSSKHPTFTLKILTQTSWLNIYNANMGCTGGHQKLIQIPNLFGCLQPDYLVMFSWFRWKGFPQGAFCKIP